MKIYSYIASGLILAGILSAFLITEIKGDYYTITTREIYDISVKQEIIINSSDLEDYSGSCLIIRISDKSGEKLTYNSGSEISIEPSELLLRKNRKMYANSPGMLVLASDNMANSAKAWIILSRKGYENVKILDIDADESFKYSFQPDSTARLK